VPGFIEKLVITGVVTGITVIDPVIISLHGPGPVREIEYY